MSSEGDVPARSSRDLSRVVAPSPRPTSNAAVELGKWSRKHQADPVDAKRAINSIKVPDEQKKDTHYHARRPQSHRDRTRPLYEQVLNWLNLRFTFTLPGVLGRYLPHLVLGLTISLVMVGAYLSVGVASNSSSKVLWSTNPATITFLGINKSGSMNEVVKCAPKLETVVFRTIVNNPVKISVATSPSGGASCGPAPASITVTATCLVSAGLCKGKYAGTVRIQQGYSTIPPVLLVTIIVN